MLLVAAPSFSPHVAAQSDCHTFPETGKPVCGKFLAYWQEHGGLQQQGFPISEPFQERSDVDGKTYTVQYFERSVLELHPENQPPHDVLLSLLGSLYFAQKYPDGVRGQRPNDSPGSVLFAGTSRRLGGEFLKYWQEHGGLAQQGYPISDEFMEKSDLDGKEYRVQYFERAVFEYHPENAPPYDVLLSQLGTIRFKRVRAACADHIMLRGSTVASGSNDVATSMYSLKSYSVEEIGLPVPLTCSVQVVVNQQLTAQSLTFDRFWRVSVVGERVDFPHAESWYIWSDSSIIGASGPGKGSEGDTELYTLIYDRQLLPEGATIGVTYGRAGIKETISEKLHFASGSPSSPGPTPSSDAWTELRQRPLNLPQVMPGAPCPVTARQTKAPASPNGHDFYVLGNGPVYPEAVAFGEDTTIRLKPYMLRPNGWYVEKVPWLTDNSDVGPVLIRARQIDGSSEVLMRVANEGPSQDVALDAAAPNYFWPGETHLRAPGCYAYQVDGNGFSYAIVFRVAVDGSSAATPTP
jgi:hypothetical protein